MCTLSLYTYIYIYMYILKYLRHPTQEAERVAPALELLARGDQPQVIISYTYTIVTIPYYTIIYYTCVYVCMNK